MKQFRRLELVLCAAALAAALGGGAMAQTPPPGAPPQQEMEEPIFGAQLMTEQERLEFRDRMRNAATQEEREQIRAEHHAAMQERARERGVTLPEMPPPRGPGMNRGQGMGPGSGMGQGMGQGMRQGMSQGQGRPPASQDPE